MNKVRADMAVKPRSLMSGVSDHSEHFVLQDMKDSNLYQIDTADRGEFSTT